MTFLRIFYIANVLVAGSVGLTALFQPETAVRSVFENAFTNSEAIRVIGAFWVSIAILSVFGVWQPEKFSFVLIIQFFYKGIWLLVAALPVILKFKTAPIPTSMAVFFLIWVIVIPIIFPWQYWVK